MSSAPTSTLFAFGLGYTATRLARRLSSRGFKIVGTTRTVEARRQALNEPTWTLLPFDAQAGLEPIAGADPQAALAGATHLLHSIRPDEEGDPVLPHHAGLIDQLIHRGSLRWIGYLSTTGVYGDHGGAWVDEDTPRRPTKARTRWRCEAEDAWLARGAQVFRLAGIYGPGRSALERVESGRARRVIKEGKVFNRIHVDDIVTVLEASIARAAKRLTPEAGRAFNVADGHPASSAEVLAHAAELLGVEPPPAESFEEAEMTPMARSFWQDNLRVRAERIRSELGVELAYPDYRAGLAACLKARTLEDAS